MSAAHKVLIAAGGTGGHFYPAIALARELKEKGCEVLFVIKENALTVTSLKNENLDYEVVKASPWVGQSYLKILFSIPAMLGGVLSSLKILKRFNATRVVGFGAYVSVPVILAASIKGIPVYLHEQNPHPGWANRYASYLARKVAISFPETQKHFGDKAVLTGNLVRRDLFSGNRGAAIAKFELQKNLRTVFIFGGSGGAKSINQAIADGLQKFIPYRDQIQFFHLTGSREESAKLFKRYHDLNLSAVVQDYSHDMNSAYACADLAVCRAGATTISELLALGIPAILIPYPYAGAHQALNAQVAENLGSAIVVRESSGLSDELTKSILETVQSSKKLTEMRKACQNFPVDLRGAASKMAHLVLS